jgi:hypothetical protein
VGHIGENVANLPPNVVCVGLEQFKDFLEQKFPRKNGINLALGACRDVRNDPARLSPDDSLMMFQYLFNLWQKASC